MKRSDPIALQAEPGTPERVEAQPGPEVQERIEAQTEPGVSAAIPGVQALAAAQPTLARTAAPRPEARIEVPLHPEVRIEVPPHQGVRIAVRLRPGACTAMPRQEKRAAAREVPGVSGGVRPGQKPVRAQQAGPGDGESEGEETSRISPDC